MEDVRYMKLPKVGDVLNPWPGTVLTIIQILSHLNFSILLTWCIIIFLCIFFFDLHQRSDTCLGFSSIIAQNYHSFKSPTSIE